MAVKYNQTGGGGFNPFGILSTLAMMIPGAQVAAPWLAGAGALTSTLQGHPEDAVKYGAGLLGKGMGGTESVFNESPIEPTMGMGDVRKSLSDLNPMAQPIDIPAPDITANQRMLNGTEARLPWSDADEAKYQGLLAQYGMGGKQAVGENADMGTRYMDNNMPQRNYDYDSLLAQYGLGGKQAVGENADMGTRYVDNNGILGRLRSDADYQNRFNELLAQYDLSDMDWTKRRQRNRGLMGGI